MSYGFKERTKTTETATQRWRGNIMAEEVYGSQEIWSGGPLQALQGRGDCVNIQGKVQLVNGQGVLEARGLLRHRGKSNFDTIKLAFETTIFTVQHISETIHIAPFCTTREDIT
jgi:hypothetical protein